MKQLTFRNKLFIIGIILLSGTFMYGQEVRVQRRNIEVSQSSEKQSDKGSSAMVGITVDPVRIYSGEFPVSVQYSPVDWFELEVGTGITWNNYFMNGFGSDWLDQAYLNEFTVESPKINLSYLIETKFFPGGYAFDDSWYLGIRYQYRRYSKDIILSDVGANQDFTSAVSYRDLALIYGAQYITDFDNIYIDYYFGLGIRYIDYKDLVQYYDGSVNQNVYGYSIGDDIAVSYLVGVKIGYLL